MPRGGVKAFSQAEKHIEEIAQLVEHNLAKVGVASSSLVFRSGSLEKEAVIKSKNLMYQ